VAPSRHDLDIAIAGYWSTKAKQQAAAAAVSSTAEGSSKAVRGGGHFNPVVNLLARFFVDAGYPVDAIKASGRQTVLPGYFRPTKAWDLVVVHKDVLVVAIELKALGGPSFGNNYNNRVEEAIGNSADLARANLSQLIGVERPWLGYFFLMDDAEGSRRATRPFAAHSFPVDKVWRGQSYQQRFGVTGRRLLDEGLYDAVCYLTSSRKHPRPREPERRLDWRHFSAAIEARLTYLGKLGLP
jgi:hypothetical protein